MGYWMVTGVDKTRTSSYDTYYDNKTSVGQSQDYAYLGIRNLSPARPEFTWPSASKNNFSLRDLQMYTPYPTGTERGKLYFVDPEVYSSESSIPGKGGYFPLEMATNGSSTTASYCVVTPTLNNPGYALSQSIAIYHFEDIDDLWENGYRISNSQAGGHTPVTTKTRWDNTKNDAAWGAGTGWNPNSGDPTTALRSKEQIVAAMFANTAIASQIQTSTLGIPTAEQLHGAVVVAGSGSRYDNTTWRGIIPITGTLVTP
jgi:hypothetical protein